MRCHELRKVRPMSLTVHELKTWPEYFREVGLGRKRFELRRNDRGFEPGHYLLLREWSPCEGYSGAEQYACVKYVLDGGDGSLGLEVGFVIMSIDLVGNDTMRAIRRESAARVGDTGVRDPSAPCAEFEPGEPDGRCETDGHYMCRECKHGKFCETCDQIEARCECPTYDEPESYADPLLDAPGDNPWVRDRKYRERLAMVRRQS